MMRVKELEDRYIVLKYKDIYNYLNSTDIEALFRIISAIRSGRKKEGKELIRSIVIEEDWPEYPLVKKMLEERINEAINQYNSIHYLENTHLAFTERMNSIRNQDNSNEPVILVG